jgi:hypothetical protein
MRKTLVLKLCLALAFSLAACALASSMNIAPAYAMTLLAVVASMHLTGDLFLALRRDDALRKLGVPKPRFVATHQVSLAIAMGALTACLPMLLVENGRYWYRLLVPIYVVAMRLSVATWTRDFGQQIVPALLLLLCVVAIKLDSQVGLLWAIAALALVSLYFNRQESTGIWGARNSTGHDKRWRDFLNLRPLSNPPIWATLVSCLVWLIADALAGSAQPSYADTFGQLLILTVTLQGVPQLAKRWFESLQQHRFLATIPGMPDRSLQVRILWRTLSVLGLSWAMVFVLAKLALLLALRNESLDSSMILAAALSFLLPFTLALFAFFGVAWSARQDRAQSVSTKAQAGNSNVDWVSQLSLFPVALASMSVAENGFWLMTLSVAALAASALFLLERGRWLDANA